MTWVIIFWISALCLVHSYIIFPLLIQLLARGKKLKIPEVQKELPFVSVILAVYNEEKVIGRKIKSMLDTDYPKDKFEIWIGSDGSTDSTDIIIQSFIAENNTIHFQSFAGRSGKTAILNALMPVAKGEIFIFTDANILFEKNTISCLIRHFADPDIGLVGANIINSGLKKEGIAYQERAYIQRENRIKYFEGVVWGSMMGAFGACYAVRRNLVGEIPRNFLMEDFYITLGVLSQNKRSIDDLEAQAFEDVSSEVSQEFKRKVRISAGNFQNLGVYYTLLWPPWKGSAFSFLSHKVLRWIGPFFLIFCFSTSALLMRENLFYRLAFIFQLAGLLMPVFDSILMKLNIHNFAMRLIAYFYIMNFALFIGFFKFLGGIKTSAWSPTERNLET